jgi:hypothetical protein
VINKLLVKKILEQCTSFDWSLQGFGMLRLYLDDEVRLHVWDSRYRVENVSIIHTHPWNFESFIIAGVMTNRMYAEHPNAMNENNFSHYRQKILTGENAKGVEPIEPCLLVPSANDTYTEGNRYFQDMQIAHESAYHDGTVSIVSRSNRTENDHAYTYWDKDSGIKGWVSAAPRKATEEEVVDICSYSLDRWFY